MEELKFSKANSSKDNHKNEAQFLYTQCFAQVMKLHDQIGHNIECEKRNNLNKSLSQIDILNESIVELQNKIHYEQTNDEIIKQREELLLKKENLLITIQQHSNQINRFKRQIHTLNIKYDQIKRQISEYKNVLENKKSCESLSQSICFQLDFQSSEKQNNLEKTIALPSLHTKSYGLLKSNFMNSKKQNRWVKIDNYFDKLKGSNFNLLIETLYKVSKKENQSFKNILKGFNVNDKMCQLSKNLKIKKQIKLLLKNKKSQ